MSEENVEIIRRGYAALAEEGVEALLPLTDPEFESTTPPSLASEPDTFRGYEGVRRWFDSFGDAMDGVYFEGKSFTPIGDKVVVDTILHARGRTTGIDTTQHAFVVWTLRNGKVLRAETFPAEEQALDAAKSG
jgi:ketosteroid isomerase-like protein